MTIDDSWASIEDWLGRNHPEVADRLRPGAHRASLERIERAIGRSLPPDLAAHWLRHNGEAAGGLGIFGGWKLLSVEGSLAEWHAWNQLFAAGERRGCWNPDPRIQPVGWNAGWIPTTSTGAGDHHCVDTCPTALGVVGQVIRFTHDSDEVLWIAPSLAIWLNETDMNLRSDRGELCDMMQDRDLVD